MIDRLFLASRRTENLVGRIDELEKLRKAIYAPAASFQVVFLSGQGGVGKSRLVEELLWRAGNLQARKLRGEIPPEHPEWDWRRGSAPAVVADLLDMSNIHYHTRTGFMHSLRDALVRAKSGLDFSRYDAAYRNLQRKKNHASYNATQQFADLAEQAFLQCYKAASAKERMVLILDTCEKLAYSHSNWLVKEQLIAREDLIFNVSQWLSQQISQGALANTTLVLVGRKEEGKEFFGLIKETLTEKLSPAGAGLVDLELGPFDLEDTRSYFLSLAESWEDYPDPGALANARTFKNLVNDEERLWVLQRYTAGQPVRLALYADLIVEGQTIPARLRDTRAMANRRLPPGLPANDEKEKLAEIQGSIETEFIDLLFSRAGLRAEILKALVRAPRGLNTQQLYLILKPGAFDQPKDQILWDEIEGELITLRRLSIIKIRADDRLGLQDEIYKIYARIMIGGKQSKEDEQKARKQMAQRLEAWADYQLEASRTERRRLIDEDERKLVFPSPANAHLVNFSHPTEREMDAWVKVREEIQFWGQEKLHYSLLSDLTNNLNVAVSEIGFYPEIADNVEADFLNLEEIYQVLYDDALLNFIEIPSWRSLNQTGGNPIDALRRMMQQSEVIRWIQRFTYHGDYDRAQKFYHDVDKAIVRFRPEIQLSWNHTFSRGERQIWFEYRRILQGETQLAVNKLEKVLAKLEILVNCSDQKIAIPETGEHGFVEHPGHDRMVSVIALGYNFLGYGYVNLGQLREAVNYYSKALTYNRIINFRTPIPLRNLSRALSDLGRGRARRVCLDAVDLEKEKGIDSAIAFSTNTLALIDNDRLRPDLAWKEAATAVAYFRRSENMRGLGLAQIQLGEALRRLAGMQIKGAYQSSDTPDAIYEEARQCLEEAMDIFTNGPASKEVMRQVEARIEMGCLLRDRLPVIQSSELREQTYANALNELSLAANLARDYNFPRLQLDAEVNQAWVYHYGGDPESVERLLSAAEMIISEDARISPTHMPHPERDDAWVFQQSSKICGLRARIAMEAFVERIRVIETPHKDKPRDDRHKLFKKDPQAQEHLRRAAANFVLAVGYSQLFSPRANALTSIYDDIYTYLKKFNAAEVSTFYRFQEQAAKDYHTRNIKMEDLGDLGQFIHECIGEY